MTEPYIRIRGLRHRFGSNEVLRGLDLDIFRGETLVILGGSGGGKSVLLKHLPGLLTVLRDGGFSDEEAFEWLFRADDSLPGTPVQALRDDRHTEVTRRAQALAL